MDNGITPYNGNAQDNMNNNASQNPTNRFSGLGGKSKKWLIIGGIAILLIIWGISAYNGMVRERNEVDTAWGQVQTDYQRRADLLPKLINSVKGYMKQEKEVLTGVTNARAGVTNAQQSTGLTEEQMNKMLEENKAAAAEAEAAGKNLDPSDEAALKKYLEAQAKYQSLINMNVNAVHEAYPELKSSELFKDYQAQLEGTENRISVSRKNFNEKAKSYNNKVETFPNVIFAKLFGFGKRAYFEAEPGAEKTPDVGFEE